jgi:hypothetical protein
MKSTLVLAMISATILVSCGKKEYILGPESSSSSSSTNSSTNNGKTDPVNGKKTIVDPKTQPVVDDKICIDNAKEKDMEEKEKLEDITDDADVIYCNGLRVRLKIFKFTSGEYRAYGFAISSSGRQSCIRSGRDFKRVSLLGFKGTLLGSGMKVSLGGHKYDADNKLIPSKKLSGKLVNFKREEFSGEMGLFENDVLTCYSIQ